MALRSSIQTSGQRAQAFRRQEHGDRAADVPWAAGRLWLGVQAGLGLGCLLLGGCGGRDYQLAPVSGRVTLDNRPLAGVVVNFQPRQEGQATPGPGSFGRTDAEGRYRLRTVEEPPVEGAVVGPHVVTIRATVEKTLETDEEVAPPVILPETATDGSLTFEVTPKGTDQADFELTSP